MATVTQLTNDKGNQSRAGLLQDALYEVLNQSRFDDMTTAETVGVLEFLKWNLINGADT